MELELRNCRINDFSSVYGLLEQLWINSKLDFDKLHAIYIRAIKSDNQKLIVGIIESEIVGFCSLTIKNNLWQAGNLGHVDELVVDNRFQGNGIGKKLITRITEIAKKNQCKRIELDSAFHRKEAHKFYESIGYENRAFLFSKELW